mgnify:CR=1 FL=1
MCGEACTSKSYDTAVADSSEISSRVNPAGSAGVNSVSSYNPSFSTIMESTMASGSCEPFLDAFHSSGYRSMNRGRYESACFCDHLSCQHMVTFCNHRLGRSTNVLGQWIRQISLGEIFLHRAVLDISFPSKGCTPPLKVNRTNIHRLYSIDH